MNWTHVPPGGNGHIEGPEPAMIFGPVPSRRLGRSLGINTIPPKRCTYSCVYCQVGRTSVMQIRRESFYSVAEIVRSAERKLDALRAAGEAVDYLTFVPDGEPTLDAGLGREIIALKSTGVRIAVITNGSLLWREDVREDLMGADWVSLKVDAADRVVWRRIDRPDGRLDLVNIVDGMEAFVNAFRGELVTETMIVEGVNDSPRSLAKIAGVLERLHPSTAYILTPIRPPAEPWVGPAARAALDRAAGIFRGSVPAVKVIGDYEGNSFACAGSMDDELLAVVAVHPLREDAVRELLARSGAGWSVVERLVVEGRLRWTEFTGKPFLVTGDTDYHPAVQPRPAAGSE